MTDNEAKIELETIIRNNYDNVEATHSRADDLLCKLLSEQGFDKTVELYQLKVKRKGKNQGVQFATQLYALRNRLSPRTFSILQRNLGLSYDTTVRQPSSLTEVDVTPLRTYLFEEISIQGQVMPRIASFRSTGRKSIGEIKKVLEVDRR